GLRRWRAGLERRGAALRGPGRDPVRGPADGQPDPLLEFQGQRRGRNACRPGALRGAAGGAGGDRDTGDRPAARAAGGGRPVCTVRAAHVGLAALAAVAGGGLTMQATVGRPRQPPVGSPWGPRQGYWLQALGCSVRRVAGAEGELAAPAPGADEVAQAAPPQVRQVGPADRDIAPPRRRAPVASEPAAGGA